MLSYQTSGSGRNIIFIHGFCANSTCFNKQVLLLSANYKVTVIDLPGIRNSPYLEELSIEKCADEIHRLLVHLQLTDAIMIGHSMGGYVTLAFAKKYPEFLKGFGLLHSTANPDTDERKLKRDQAIRVIQEKGYEFYIESFIPPLFSAHFQNPDILNESIIEAKKTTAKALIAELLAMKNRPSSISFLEETDLPVLFIGGKADAIIPYTDVIKQAAMVRNGFIQIIDNAAHMSMHETPDLCTEIIAEFAEHVFNG